MKVYTDPRIFDLAGAVAKIAVLPIQGAMASVRIGTEGAPAFAPAISEGGRQGEGASGWRGSGTSTSAGTGGCSAVIGVIGNVSAAIDSSLALATGENRQQKTLSGEDRVETRQVGLAGSRSKWMSCVSASNRNLLTLNCG